MKYNWSWLSSILIQLSFLLKILPQRKDNQLAEEQQLSWLRITGQGKITGFPHPVILSSENSSSIGRIIRKQRTWSIVHLCFLSSISLDKGNLLGQAYNHGAAICCVELICNIRIYKNEILQIVSVASVVPFDESNRSAACTAAYLSSSSTSLSVSNASIRNIGYLK